MQDSQRSRLSPYSDTRTEYNASHSASHDIKIYGRKRATVTGVKEVISFDCDEILLETTGGMLTFQGDNLHVKRLTLEKGEVDIEGDVCELKYSDSHTVKDAGSFFGKLFR